MTKVFTGLILHTGKYYLGLDLRRRKLFVREGPCRVFTDMELLFVGMESICYTILELGKITHDSSVHRTHIESRVVLLGVGFAPLQIACERRSL